LILAGPCYCMPLRALNGVESIRTRTYHNTHNNVTRVVRELTQSYIGRNVQECRDLGIVLPFFLWRIIS
jgi:hypothetical protein